MSRRFTRGFTLIELLVVIAIIGILASVVLVSLQSARKKGNDSRVISDVQQLRALTESSYDGTTYNAALVNNQTPTASTVGSDQSTYFGILYSNPIAKQLADDAANNGGGVHIITNDSDDITSYAIYGMLPSTKGTGTQTYFCIDSEGKTNQSVSTTLTDTDCSN